MKIKMFETTTQLCNGAFVVNTNPFIFALAKTQASRLKNSHFAFCVMTPKSQQNQQLTLPSTWSF